MVVTDQVSSESGIAAGRVIVTSAEVFDISGLGTQGDRFISLRMPQEAAAEVAAAADADQVRLVLVAGVDR